MTDKTGDEAREDILRIDMTSLRPPQDDNHLFKYLLLRPPRL
jgi:hypothetical protein